MSKDNKVLGRAVKEEAIRKDAIFEEFKKLYSVTCKAIKELSVEKALIIKELDQDTSKIIEANSVFKSGVDPFPLVHNKLVHLLKGAKIFIDKHFEQVLSGDHSFIPMTASSYDPADNTSLINYAQTALLEILSIIRKKSVVVLPLYTKI